MSENAAAGQTRLDDAKLLGATFLEGVLPDEDEWLGKYFAESQQRLFLSYYLQMRGILKDPGFRGKEGHKRLHACYEDHTGTRCSERWVYKMLGRLAALEAAMAEAASGNDMQMVASLRGGKWRLPKGV